MLTEEKLVSLMTETEADNIERTESPSKLDKFGEAICAFANDLPDHRSPGYLLIGVADDGSVSGLTITNQLLQTLGGIR